MTTSFDSEIRVRLADVLGGAFLCPIDAKKIRLPARHADASVRPPQEADPERALGADFGSLYGAPLVESVHLVNGWLLFDFSPAFFGALAERVNALFPAPSSDGGRHAVNRMLALMRHGQAGCPDHPALHRALLLAICAHESRAAYRRAEHAAQTLFHSVPPRDRCALLSGCGALGGALARLLLSASGATGADPT